MGTKLNKILAAEANNLLGIPRLATSPFISYCERPSFEAHCRLSDVFLEDLIEALRKHILMHYIYYIWFIRA